jgi:Carboxypeptidase regulatory-like domain
MSLISACLACVSLLSSAPGQGRVISGRIFVSGDSSRAVADAEVALLPTLAIVRSDSAGAFVFRGVRQGSYMLRVRRVGFEVATTEVQLGAMGNDQTIHVALRTGARALAEIVVSGERVLFPARLAEPYSRVARARGAFFTRSLIDSLRPWDLLSLLGRVPGIRVNARAIRVTRCDNHGATPGKPGNLHVFLDGVRQTNYSGMLTRDAADALRDIVVTSVELVEIHTSINTIPPQFADDACAVILVWTR